MSRKMSADKNYDELLYPILHHEGQITGFLDAVFGFLSRRTDFFRVQRPGSAENIGLPPGAAEGLVKKYFLKYYQEVQAVTSPVDDVPLDDITVEVPPADNEVLIEAEEQELDSLPESEKHSTEQETEHVYQSDPSCYNGAVYDNYSWSQSIKDIDVQVNVPYNVVSGKQVKVELTQNALRAEIFQGNEWRVLVDGNFRWPVNLEESFWTLVPQKHIHVSLEKTKERWWNAFFESEPQIDVQKIDASQPYEDLDEESQAKIRELMYNEQQKRLGKPTIEQEKIADILKDAWNMEGSPFRGQPFDPKIALGCSTDGNVPQRLPK